MNCKHTCILQDKYGYYCVYCNIRFSIKEIPERLFEMIKKEIDRTEAEHINKCVDGSEFDFDGTF